MKKRKDAEAALRESRDLLDAKVRERTTELRVTNERLQSEIAERKRTEEEHHKTQAELEHVTRISTMSRVGDIDRSRSKSAAGGHRDHGRCMFALVGSGAAERRQGEGVGFPDHFGRESRRGNRSPNSRSLTKTAPQKSLLHLDDVIREVLSLLNVELRDAGIKLELNLEEKLPAVLGDSVQLQQVVLNLIVNATEAMGDVKTRSRRLEISVKSMPEKMVCVAVRDNGCGLDESRVGSLFETFVTTKSNGIGMGLPISRAIVEAHGGRLVAAANKGFGATFAFELPAIQENGK